MKRLKKTNQVTYFGLSTLPTVALRALRERDAGVGTCWLDGFGDVGPSSRAWDGATTGPGLVSSWTLSMSLVELMKSAVAMLGMVRVDWRTGGAMG